MDSITKEVLDRAIKDNLDIAKQIVNAFSENEVFEKINDVLKLCDVKSKDLFRFSALLSEQNDSESEKYIQKMSDAISFFDEAYSMMRMIECGYTGMANCSRKYIMGVVDNKED